MQTQTVRQVTLTEAEVQTALVEWCRKNGGPVGLLAGPMYVEPGGATLCTLYFIEGNGETDG